MNLSLYIARRYLFSKKSHNVINIISAIAMVGVGVGSLALIVVLSAFNGLESLVESLYSSFDPEIKITVIEGKTFDSQEFPKDDILKIEGIAHYSESLEETVFLQYKGHETFATIKGVESDFLEMSGLDSLIIDGYMVLEKEEANYAVLGYGIADALAVFITPNTSSMKVYAAKRKTSRSASLNPEDRFKFQPITPAGILSINPDFDYQYTLVPMRFARELLDYPTEVTSVEIGLKKGVNAMDIKSDLQALVGDKFEVKTRYELNELLFKTNKTEKWITYLILSFILIIATFNVVGSLTMLIIDKKDDIQLLKSLGAGQQLIKRIFLFEGMLIATIGGLGGLTLGALLCLAQMGIGLVRLQGGIVDFYPVELELLDFAAILGTVLFIGFVSSWFPVRFATRRHFVQKKT